MRSIIVAWLLAASLLAGCASDKAARELEMSRLQSSLPGAYRAESAESTASLIIMPVRARFVGENVYYLQWLASASSAPEARLLSLVPGEGEKVEQISFDFVEPPRWRDALAAPELFLGLVTHDVRAAGRCELTFEEDGALLRYSCGGVKLPMRRVR
jgi:hypothetical protein